MFAHRTACQRNRQRSFLQPASRIAIVLAAASGLAVAWSAGAIGQVSSVIPGGRPIMRPLDPAHPETYRQVLIFGLQAKLPTELEFIDSVVAAVEAKKLPPPLVDQSYFWARSRAGSSQAGRSSRPIIYFIPALEARVNKLRLNVDLKGGLP